MRLLSGYPYDIIHTFCGEPPPPELTKNAKLTFQRHPTVNWIRKLSFEHSLKQSLHKYGWHAATDSTWDSLLESPPVLAIIAPPLDTIPSPQGNAIYVLVERLAASLPIPTVVFAKWPETGKPKPSPIGHRIIYYRKSLTEGWERYLPHRIKKALWGSGAPHLLRYAANAGMACRLLKIQVVIIEDVPIFALNVRSKIGANCKLLLHQHIDAPQYSTTKLWNKISNTLNGIIFVSNQTLQMTEKTHGRLSVLSWVVYNGVDLSHYDPRKTTDESILIRKRLSIPLDAHVLLFVGRLVPYKGPAEAAEAFNLANIPNSYLLVAGDFDVKYHKDDAYLERIRRAAKESNGRICLLGNISQESLPAYYSVANAVIIPSIGSEGLPKVATEALAMGCPVIASDRGGTWELLRNGDNGFLIKKPDSPEDIADSIICYYKQVNANTHQKILDIDRPLMSEKHMVEKMTTICLQATSKNTI